MGPQGVFFSLADTTPAPGACGFRDADMLPTPSPFALSSFTSVTAPSPPALSSLHLCHCSLLLHPPLLIDATTRSRMPTWVRGYCFSVFPLTKKRGSARAPLLHGVLYLLCVDTRDLTLQTMRALTLLYSTLQTLQTLLYLTLQNLSLPRTPARWPFFRLPGAHQQRFCHRQNLESKEPGVWRGVSVLSRAPALPPTALSP